MNKNENKRIRITKNQLRLYTFIFIVISFIISIIISYSLDLELPFLMASVFTGLVVMIIYILWEILEDAFVIRTVSPEFEQRMNKIHQYKKEKDNELIALTNELLDKSCASQDIDEENAVSNLVTSATGLFIDKFIKYCSHEKINTKNIRIIESWHGPCYVSKTNLYLLGTTDSTSENLFNFFLPAFNDTKPEINRVDNIDKRIHIESDLRKRFHSASSEDRIDQVLEKCRNNIEIYRISLEQKHDFATVIPLSDIVMFRVVGDIQFLTEVSGNGGGANLTGAIAGGIIAGGVGAIIGSKYGTDINVSSYSKKEDTRVILISYHFNGNTITEEVARGQDVDHALEVLRELMPQKEESYILAAEKQDMAQSVSNADEIKKYKSLFDEGIITKEEYEAKKKQLLGI